MAAPSAIGYALGKRKGKKRAMRSMADGPRYTKEALYAQRRLELARKYSNKKNLAKAEAKYGKQAKETEKVPNNFGGRMSSIMRAVLERQRRNQGMM